MFLGTKATRPILLVAMALAVSLAIPAVASADNYTYKSSGKGASADSWTDMANGGYSSTNVYVGTMRDVSKSSGAPATKTSGLMGWFGYDLFDPGALANDVSDDTYAQAYCDLVDPSFSADKALLTAMLGGAFPCTRYEWVGITPWNDATGDMNPPTSETVTLLHVDLAWTGTGALRTESWKNKTQMDGFLSIFNSKGTYRNATAVGSIYDDAGNVYLDGSFDQAQIFDTRDASIQHGDWPEY